MKAIVLASYLLLLFIVLPGDVLAAHILEPLGTEIAATPPRGRMFGQVQFQYRYSREENGTTKTTQLLPIEFDIGLGERLQLNLGGEILLREETTGSPRESGIEEIGVGIKHRFLDETRLLPDAAFAVNYSPSIGLKGNGHGIGGTLILSKNLHPRFVVHLNGGYELETDRETDVTSGTDEVVNHETWIYNVAPMFRAIPDQLMVLAELNGRTEVSGNTVLTLAPEVIVVIQTETFFALQNLAIKLAVPFGLNGDSPDIGVKIGLSKLF